MRQLVTQRDPLGLTWRERLGWRPAPFAPLRG